MISSPSAQYSKMRLQYVQQNSFILFSRLINSAKRDCSVIHMQSNTSQITDMSQHSFSDRAGLRWSDKSLSDSICTTKCAVNKNAAIAELAMDDWLHKKLKMCKIVQGFAQPAALACRCKRVRFK